MTRSFRGLILAGGKGVRLSALGQLYPKALLPVAGGAIIHHQLFRLVEAGISQIATSGTITPVELDAARSLTPWLPSVHARLEGVGGFGMARAVAEEAARGTSPLVVIHGDLVLGLPLLPLLEAMEGFDGAVLVTRRAGAPDRQAFTISRVDGSLALQKPDRRPAVWMGGAYVLDPRCLEHQAIQSLVAGEATALDLIAGLVRAGARLRPLTTAPTRSVNVNTPADLLRGSLLLLSLSGYDFWRRCPGRFVGSTSSSSIGDTTIVGPSWVASDARVVASTVGPGAAVCGQSEVRDSHIHRCIVAPHTLLMSARATGLIAATAR